MKSELSKVKNHLSPRFKLPIAGEDILQIYHLMTIEGRCTEKYIIFKLRIPLLAMEDFELFSIIPIPTLSNKTFFAIQPSSPYLIVNLHRDQYYPLDKNELRACILTATDNYICKQARPIYRKGSSVSSCEVDLLNHLPQSAACQIIKIGEGPHWIQLHLPNHWIFALKQDVIANVVCGDNVTQITISGSGILSLYDECIINQELISIQGQRILPTKVRLSYVPIHNLTKINVPEQGGDIPLAEFELKSVAEQVNTAKKELHQVYDFRNIQLKDKHHFTVGYTSLILTFGISCYLFWSCISRLRSKKSSRATPDPIPTTESSETPQPMARSIFNVSTIS